MRVLFLCTGNSVRSQMAEALLRSIGGERFEVWSAGVSPAEIHPMTIRVLEEEGLDLGGQKAKSVEEVPLDRMDRVITLCGHARDSCPRLPEGVRTEHWPIEDPSGVIGTAEQRLQLFRETREKIRDRVLRFVKQARDGGN